VNQEKGCEKQAMIRKTVKITDPMGLHLRPAGKLCEEAVRFQSRITLEYSREGALCTANAKSVLGILAACIGRGETIAVCCDGPDEEEAAREILKLFDEMEQSC
jgi:phosphocarrier protein HPr